MSTPAQSYYDIDGSLVYFVDHHRQPQATVPAGEYGIDHSIARGWYLYPKPSAPIDGYVPLPNRASEETQALVGDFVAGKYRESMHEMGMIHKLAVLLWGPPGTSKSVTIYELKKFAVSQNWVVIDATGQDPDNVAEVLDLIRKIEPTRYVMVIFEEFESTVKRYEHEVLQLLDGNSQFEDVLYVLTTNFIKQIPERVFLRFRRLPFQFKFDLPDDAVREAFFRAKIPGRFQTKTFRIKEWVKASEGFSLDQCAQMILNVFAFRRTLAEVRAEVEFRKKVLTE